MYETEGIRSQQLELRVTGYALAVLLLTSVHHAYGAYIYATPWRLHVVYVSGLAAMVIVGTLVLLRKSTDDFVNAIAFWTFAAVTLLIPVAAVGLFEGGYNHALKDVLWLLGASPSLMRGFFPPPVYEMPNDLFFEITGVLQLFGGIAIAPLLHRAVKERLHP